MSSILEIKNLKKNFQHIKVLDDISFCFSQNSSYAITGISGTGKSTLMHILSGIDSPTSGEIFFDHLNIKNFSFEQKDFFLNKSIGLIFQNPYLIKELTVIENVMLKGLIAKENFNECKNKALEVLQKIGLQDKADEYPTNLSGGQQQRVALARAIFNKPKFLLADEPTANLDQKTAYEIAKLLFDCKKEWSMGLIIATHDQNLANLAENLLEIRNGKLFNLKNL